jgi:hypothetical protein
MTDHYSQALTEPEVPKQFGPSWPRVGCGASNKRTHDSSASVARCVTWQPMSSASSRPVWSSCEVPPRHPDQRWKRGFL